jgi:hypothetical protein
MRPDTFTITSFWLDWLLMPILLVGAWLTIRWALADSRKASDSQIAGESFLPAWAFSFPLFIAAAAWLIAGFGTLIKQDYWEMRLIFAAFILWTLCCAVGALLLFLMFLRRGRGLSPAGVMNLIGLALMSLLMVLPGLINHSSPESVTLIGHIWFVFLAVSVGLLTGSVISGFPYKFPRFPLGLGILFLVGWGLSEITFKQTSFPWLVRIWKLHLGLDYLDAFPLSDWWQIAGALKFLIGVGIGAVLIIGSRRLKHPPASPRTN